MLSSTPSSHSRSPPSHSTSPTTDEHTALLPHEHGPALESQQPTPQHTDSPPTPNQPNAQYIPERVAELEHIISRIDTIEIGLWQNRVAHGDSLIITPTTTNNGERLSRVSTYIGRIASRHKSSIGLPQTSIDDLTPRPVTQDTHRYFWADVVGISLLGLLVAGMLLYVGLSLLKGNYWCGGEDGNMLVFICVQVLVSMGFGLLTEVPNRWVVPFVLPMWVIGVVGTMFVIQVFTCRA